MLASLRNLFGAAPRRVTVVDVSARDGLQAEPVALPPAVRANWIRAVLSAGVPEAEAGSFVHPGRVPQMAGTDRVLAELGSLAEKVWVLVPNRTGLESAMAAGARNAVFLLSATETHCQANLGRSVSEVLSELRGLLSQARDGGVRARVALSMCWIDPVEGPVPRERVLVLCEALREAGAEEITLCDTYGGASPLDVAFTLEGLFPLFPPETVGLHLHDTFGVAGANALVGLTLGVRRFDGSIAGLGGCPFAPGARGNMATEDLVYLLHALGADTGADLEALRKVKTKCLAWLGRPDAAKP